MGSTCAFNSTKTQDLLVNLVCADNGVVSAPSVVADECSVVLTYNGKAGCPIFSLDKFFAFMKQYDAVWGVTLIFLGLFVAFFGNHMLNATIYIFVTLAVFFVGSMVFYNMFL